MQLFKQIIDDHQTPLDLLGPRVNFHLFASHFEYQNTFACHICYLQTLAEEFQLLVTDFFLKSEEGFQVYLLLCVLCSFLSDHC